MKNIAIALLISLISFSSLFAQKWSVGIGMLSYATYSPHLKGLYVNDSISIHTTETGVSYLKNPLGDARTYINLNYLLLKKSSFIIESSLTYYKRYSGLQLRKVHNIFTLRSILPVVNASFIFQMLTGFKLSKKIYFSVGLGPALHIKKKSTYYGNASNKQGLKEPHEQAYNMFKTITLNYSFALEYFLSRRFSILARHYSSIGSISKPFNIYNKSYNYALKWKSLGLSIQYKWSLNTNKNE